LNLFPSFTNAEHMSHWIEIEGIFLLGFLGSALFSDILVILTKFRLDRLSFIELGFTYNNGIYYLDEQLKQYTA
jgi:hypothetical protein